MAAPAQGLGCAAKKNQISRSRECASRLMAGPAICGASDDRFGNEIAIRKIRTSPANSMVGLQNGRAPVAQLDRASAFEAERREFESLRARHSLFSGLTAPDVTKTVQ